MIKLNIIISFEKTGQSLCHSNPSHFIENFYLTALYSFSTILIQLQSSEKNNFHFNFTIDE